MDTATIPVNITVRREDAARLSGQCERILMRLRQGPATNHELAQIALKYTSRIDEVRRFLAHKTGEQLIAKRESGGVWNYEITPPPGSAQLEFFRRVAP
jgi:hypothetical protein